VVTVVSTCGDC